MSFIVMDIKLKILDQDSLSEFRQLLGSADFGGCFCAVWTSYDKDWEKRCADPAQPNFFITERELNNKRHTGFLAYVGDQVVGWTGSGPKTSFPLLRTKLGSRLTEFSSEIWSIGCLAVKSKFRGKNISEKIVQAVLLEAKAKGAKTVEAYPVRPFHEPRMYRGSYKLYQNLGFQELHCDKDEEFEILLMSKLI